ncbi:hypothetical protein H2199_006893 [Coniosporium tulheliwenetii]|uniref:Uncharacterized protein n=1 Tax=Coniosporium tulheliwenetii TaxID=3383036 RepID=A0ACC2YSD9_9PEZI|nr:hypothetical protein H2199_006893 [Cladosporium sp. JES 115]
MHRDTAQSFDGIFISGTHPVILTNIQTSTPTTEQVAETFNYGVVDYDTGSIGAVTEMPWFLRTFGHFTPFMRGFTVSLIMLAGACPAFFAGQLADRFGRLRITMVGALVFVVGAALEGGAYDFPMFLVGRALCGLGQGVWLSNVSVYICEIAPSARRGMLVSTPQLTCTAGICIGYFTCYGSVRMDSTMSWRIPYIFQAVGGLVLATACCFLPESPRWLLVNGRRDEAMRNLERLDFSRTEAEKDFLNASEQATLSKSTMEGFLLTFQRQYRARTILGLFVLGMMQLSGIDGVLYFAPTLFAQAGLPSQTASFLASGVSAILMLAISIPALLLADRWGRRTSAISGGLALSSCMIIIGSLYASKVVHPQGAGKWFVIVLIFAFALTYCFTWAVVGKIYASEIQPTNTRAAANCLAQGLSFFTNWLVAIITPVLLASSSSGAYFLFGFLALGRLSEATDAKFAASPTEVLLSLVF